MIIIWSCPFVACRCKGPAAYALSIERTKKAPEIEERRRGGAGDYWKTYCSGFAPHRCRSWGLATAAARSNARVGARMTTERVVGRRETQQAKGATQPGRALRRISTRPQLRKGKNPLGRNASRAAAHTPDASAYTRTQFRQRSNNPGPGASVLGCYPCPVSPQGWLFKAFGPRQAPACDTAAMLLPRCVDPSKASSRYDG